MMDKSIAYMTSMKFYDAIMFSRHGQGTNGLLPSTSHPNCKSDGDHYVSFLVSHGRHDASLKG
ncbi:MAG: hypothetical protein MZV63_35190 [Marinilabiliales bacterium]|nr:hypothetical protein [Marinilabiliales bacterium]